MDFEKNIPSRKFISVFIPILLILMLVLVAGFFVLVFIHAQKDQLLAVRTKLDNVVRENRSLREAQERIVPSREDLGEEGTWEMIPSWECYSGECLFQYTNSNGFQSIYGLGKLQGYYSQTEGTAWGETRWCDELVVTGGTDLFVKAFESMVAEGNTVNQMDKDGNLIVNLSLSDLPSNEQNEIKASSKDNEIELVALKFVPRKETEAPVCYSFIQILDVNEVLAP